MKILSTVLFVLMGTHVCAQEGKSGEMRTPSIADSSLKLAQGQSSGNGGQGVYKGDNLFLRDLVENSNCTFKTPRMVLKAIPEMKNILDKLEQADPVFKAQVAYNFGAATYCFTQRKLIPLSYNNSDDIYIFPNSNYEQVAIYDEGFVFVSVPLLNAMNAENQGYLMLHESLHELYDLEKQKRQDREPRLRQFVMNIKSSFNSLDRELMETLKQEANFKRLDTVEASLLAENAYFDYFYAATELEAIKKLYKLNSVSSTQNTSLKSKRSDHIRKNVLRKLISSVKSNARKTAVVDLVEYQKLGMINSYDIWSYVVKSEMIEGYPNLTRQEVDDLVALTGITLSKVFYEYKETYIGGEGYYDGIINIFASEKDLLCKYFRTAQERLIPFVANYRHNYYNELLDTFPSKPYSIIRNTGKSVEIKIAVAGIEYLKQPLCKHEKNSLIDKIDSQKMSLNNSKYRRALKKVTGFSRGEFKNAKREGIRRLNLVKEVLSK